MAKKRKKSAKKRKPTTAAIRGEVLELRLPDELYAEAAKLEEDVLTSILQSVLGGQPRYGVKYVTLSPQSEEVAVAKLKQYMKPC